MNDRFKFRAFDTFVEKMIQNHISICEGELYEWCPDGLHIKHDIGDSAIVMQCTGLKDKNGNLIYEGDIVKEEDSCFYWKVVWNTDVTHQWSLRRIEPDSVYPHIITFSSLLSWKKYEVIGNIYENVNLLESEE